MKTTDITQQVHFNASPERIYHVLMDTDEHAAFTGGDADIDPAEGGHFSVHNGYITGQNLELIPGKKIVQSWHAEEDNWPDDYYSKVIFDIQPDNGGALLIFTHQGVPEEYAADISDGWETYYWQPMKEMFG